MAPVLKVILLGDSGVGKTSLMDRYIYNRFTSRYRRTIGADFHTKDVIVDNKVVTLQIWDTVGQERFQSLGNAFFRGADCVILVYDVTSPSSFYSLELWKEEFLIQGMPRDPKKFPFVVLGNKSDLGKKLMANDEIQKMLPCDYVVPHFETSAKDNINIQEAFVVVAQLALQHEKEDIIFNPVPENLILTEKHSKTNQCLC